MSETELSRRIRERADRDGLPAEHPLREHAKKFDEATAGFYGDPQTVPVKSFMGVYARAKRAWCEYSGESLV